MDEKVALVFSWDPKARAWTRERGPEDAVPPPAGPIDDGAVQTYFLDPANGRWQPTILGLRARQIAAELGNAYRTAAVPGLAMRDVPAVNPRLIVEREGDHSTDPSSRATLRMLGVILVLVVLIGGGAVAANAVFGTSAADADATPSTTAAAARAGATTGAQSAPATTATPSEADTRSQTPAAPAPATAPIAALATQPIMTVSYSATLSGGVRLTYTGPNAVTQQSVLYMTFRAYQPNGQLAFDNLTVYLGTGAGAQGVTVSPDRTGTYSASLKVTLPKGDQVLSARFGQNGEQKALGTISVR